MSSFGNVTAAKNLAQSVVGDLKTGATQPSFVADRFAYGKITKINDKQQAQIELYSRKDEKGNFQKILKGKFIPIATQQSTINLLYGGLREGLQVLVHWRGKLRPSWAIAHIIGDEELDILEEEKVSNKANSPPMAFLSGGMTDL